MLVNNASIELPPLEESLVARLGYFLSPWPASALDTVPPCKVGIRGSSLTAVDAAVARV